MISNWFYYCITLLTATLILSSCLNSNEVEYEYSADPQITSLRISSPEDSLKVLSKVSFSIDQVSSAPVIFNKDSLPYLFDVESVKMEISTNNASGIKLSLVNPDSTYLWNKTDSVMIKKLKHIEIFAQDGKTTKKYTFQLRTHQQDPDTIFWQNVKNNYISSPVNQVTIADQNQFFTYYQSGTAIKLSTSSLEDGSTWTDQSLIGMPQNVELSSIQNITFDNNITWYASGSDNKLYVSANGKNWSLKATTYPVKAIYGKLPSFTNDSIMVVVKDGSDYKFAKTKDFSSLRVLNTIPSGFPLNGFTFTSVNDPLIYTAKYLIITGGVDINNLPNSKIWLLQEKDNKITLTSNSKISSVTGSSLFKYDKKLYLMTSENNKNVFYTSSSYGGNWEKASKKQSLPANFTNRKNQSVIVDDKDNIWIFGGKTDNQIQLVEIWKGRINKLFTK